MSDQQTLFYLSDEVSRLRKRVAQLEAVVEAARQLRNEGWFAPWADHAAVKIILAALDEPPTGTANAATYTLLPPTE